VYGTAVAVPINEDHRLYAQSPYAATKIAADQLALSFYCTFDLPVTIARPFNTYGPRQSLRAVIPSIMLQLVRGAKELELGSVHTTRDLSYVADTVDGLLSLAEADGIEGEVFNLGSNFEISVRDLALEIAKLVGVDLRIRTETRRVRPPRSEVERLWSDNSKMLGRTSWSPRYASLDGLRLGLQETLEWFRDRNNIALYPKETYGV
jgi:nucleoside-diphosphate-sugar epimerase